MGSNMNIPASMEKTNIPSEQLEVSHRMGKAGAKSTSLSSGSSLPEGVSAEVKLGDVKGMYAQNEDQQRMPRHSDRV